jgi:hypothetical protein
MTTTGAAQLADASASSVSSSWWDGETRARIAAVLDILTNYLPWLLPEFVPLREISELAIKREAYSMGPSGAAAFAEGLEISLRHAWLKLIGNAELLRLGEQLREALPAAIGNLRALSSWLQAIANRAQRLGDETEFAFLSNPARKVLSIGYDVRAQKLHDACYDMIASEARIATFLAIARDEIPQQTWMRLSREHACAFGRFVLLSWTGTMFEYLMPALWMRSYPDTLISRSLAAVVHVQRSFARTLNIPWGISESGAARKDDSGHYSYKAFGVPDIALWVEATAGPVVSPYSTFLGGRVWLLRVRGLHIVRQGQAGSRSRVDGASPGYGLAGHPQPAAR